MEKKDAMEAFDEINRQIIIKEDEEYSHDSARQVAERVIANFVSKNLLIDFQDSEPNNYFDEYFAP